MPTAGPIRPIHGTRFELTLERVHEGRAQYLASVMRSEATWTLSLELSLESTSIVRDDAALPDDARTQLLALSKTTAKRSADEPWPRRVLRWRQPGVR
ncbi:MAG: hypothetical protein Q8Q09_12395 [Deltaproteobacteria bacterium]|nr:hypothetical protein [Deltaproteobacteria bacterium]